MKGGINSALPVNILFRQLFKNAAIEERKREEKRGGSKGSLVDRPIFRRKLTEIAGTEEKVAEERVFRQSDQAKQANKPTSIIKNGDIDLAKSEKENLRELITDNVAENFQSPSNYQDENNDMSLVEVQVEKPSIKSRSTDCTLKSKEEDNRQKSRASEVFDKYKSLKRNDDINSKSHFQPDETDNIRKKNCSQRRLKSTLVSKPIYLQKMSAAAATKERSEKETIFQKCDQDNLRQNGRKIRITNEPNNLEVFTDEDELENMIEYKFNSNKAGTKTASSHLGMNTDDNGTALLDEK